jgi:alkaline phosphatase D
VIIWTRVTTPDGAPTDVSWSMSRDIDGSDVVAEGNVTADASADYTVKLDVTGLDPATTYYYRFDALEETSAIGRTRTAPQGATARLRLGICSCASYAHGHFNAYRQLAGRLDLDLIVHLGDYIYEYASGGYGMAREYDPPHEIVTLEDYRRRYAHYRRDADLQAAHQQHPWALIWDDHETANNSWSGGAENHDSSEGEWEDRKQAALQAYLEWLPIREQSDGRLFRVLKLGDLADLMLLDTRIWGRDEQAVDEDDPTLNDPARTLLGDDQETWLDEQLRTSTARYKLLGQQVMMGQLPQFLNTDQWDGYPAARQRLFDLIRSDMISDVVVFTGDIHSSWAMDLTDDPFDMGYDPTTGAGSVGVELVTPAITSPGFPDALASVADGLIADNPHLSYAEVVSRGYVVVDLDHERAEAVWYHQDTIEQVNEGEAVGAVLQSQSGANHWVETAEPTPAPDAPAGAPA